MSFFKDRTILVTGACGTVGRELVRQLLDCQPREIRSIDTNESEIFFFWSRNCRTMRESTLSRRSARCARLATFATGTS